MGFGNDRESAENKLILLYLIEKLNMPISNLQITKLILENKFMNYFYLQQFLNELCEAFFLTNDIKENKTYYNISSSGIQTLNYFSNMITFGIKKRIDESISTIRKSLKEETLITADFLPESETEFIVKCKVHEDSFSLIDLKVTVGTRNDARLICDNWNSHSHLIYAEIIESLIKKRPQLE
jgi:hypothetical protein